MLLTSMPAVTVHRFTFTLSERFCYVCPVKFLIRTNGSCVKLLELWFPNRPNYGPQTNSPTPAGSAAGSGGSVGSGSQASLLTLTHILQIWSVSKNHLYLWNI